MSCDQIAAEAQAVVNRAAVAAHAQDSQRSADAAITTVGVVLFWPALFFLNGDDADTAELARLRGELIAMEQASRQKNCGITFQSEPATQTASAAPA